MLFHSLGVRAGLASRGAAAPPVTIKLIIEGEEESGSEHFADLLRRERERLACDVIVITDTTMWAADVPSMCTGMRGLASVEVTLTGPSRDLHSGSFGGGVPNPLHAMASLLAGLHDDDGRVTLPRFYDRVLPLSEQERELLARLPFDAKQWLAEAGDSGATSGERGFSTLERIWARPTGGGQRDVGRSHRPGRQDHHPEGRARQDHVPPGRRPGPRRGRRGVRRVRAGPRSGGPGRPR